MYQLRRAQPINRHGVKRPGPSGHHFGVWNISEVKNQPPPFHARVQFSKKKNVSGKKMQKSQFWKTNFHIVLRGKKGVEVFRKLRETPRNSCLYT